MSKQNTERVMQKINTGTANYILSNLIVTVTLYIDDEQDESLHLVRNQ